MRNRRDCGGGGRLCLFRLVFCDYLAAASASLAGYQIAFFQSIRGVRDSSEIVNARRTAWSIADSDIPDMAVRVAGIVF